MSTTECVPETATPAHREPSLDASLGPTEKRSYEGKEAKEWVKDQQIPLRRSISNPIAAIDPATQLSHLGSDDGEATDLENGVVASDKEDPNMVDFDGPDDPQKAINWSRKHKFSMLGLVSVMTFITYACNILLKNCVVADKDVR
jgi:hypothetical protein